MNGKGEILTADKEGEFDSVLTKTHDDMNHVNDGAASSSA